MRTIHGGWSLIPLCLLVLSLVVSADSVDISAVSQQELPQTYCLAGLDHLSQVADHLSGHSPKDNLYSEKWGFLQICDKALGMIVERRGDKASIPKQELERIENHRSIGTRYLEMAHDLGNSKATAILADMYLYGNFSTPRNFSRSLELYESLAAEGNAGAQFMCGVFYSTGMFDTVEPDQAKASMYYTFAAYGGDIRGNMAIGFRHMAGISGHMSSENALPFYKAAAEKASTFYMPTPEIPFSHRHISDNAFSIAEIQVGGIYGPGVGESGAERRMSLSTTTPEDALEYYQYLTESRDASSLFALYKLAHIYYDGGRYSEPDIQRAIRFALEGANLLWTPHGRVRSSFDKTDPLVVEYGGGCAVFLGQLYLRGEGVEQNTSTASSWFKRGADLENSFAETALALMYLNGVGMEKDQDRAVVSLKKAAEKGSNLAQLNMAKILLHNGEYERGYEMIAKVAPSGSLEAIYLHAQHLAEEAKRSGGFVDAGKSDEAASYFKHFVERMEDMHSPLGWAQREYRDGRYESAILGFVIAAEQGYQSAQNNIAFILDSQAGYIDMRREDSKNIHNFSNSLKTALLYWGRSAKQSNKDALLKMGDYYLSGKGTEADPSKAFTCYNSASNKASGLANWNLGWMHENGIGVEKDYHLAKRYYDLALTAESSAYLPVQLSLTKLFVKSFWNDITGGKIKSMMDDSLNRPKVSLQEGWTKLWNAWKEMDFKVWDDEEERYEHMTTGGSSASTSGITNEDIRDLVIILAILSLILYFWVRQANNRRRQRQNGDIPQDPARERPQIRFGVGLGFFGMNIAFGNGGGVVAF